MKPETRIKVIYNIFLSDDGNSFETRSWIVSDEKKLLRVLKTCHNNRRLYNNRIGIENPKYECYFDVEDLKFEECIGRVCDIGHFHVDKYKPLNKPTFYNKAVELFNNWVKECETKYYEYLETKKTEAEKEKEKEEYEIYIKLKEKYKERT